MQTILAVLGTVGFFSLIGWLIKIAITHKANELSLKKEINSLKEEKSKIEFESEKEINQLKEDNMTLQEQISKYAHRNIVLSTYPFDSHLGIRKHKDTSQAACSTCALLEPPRISPLQVKDTGWTCNAPNCNFSKDNPNWRPPTQANSDYDPLS